MRFKNSGEPLTSPTGLCTRYAKTMRLAGTSFQWSFTIPGGIRGHAIRDSPGTMHVQLPDEIVQLLRRQPRGDNENGFAGAQHGRVLLVAH